jgi:hypothetical protein
MAHMDDVNEAYLYMTMDNNILPIEYAHDSDSGSEYGFELDTLSDLESDFGYNNPPSMATISTTLYSAILTILIYTVSIIIAAYLVVQAMEAVSFILSPNTGIVQKIAWLLFLPLVAVIASLVIDVIFDVEMGAGQVQFPGWLQGW